MEKKLLKRLSYMFISMGGILIILFSIWIYFENKNISLNKLSEILLQVELNYEETLRNYNQEYEMYKKDYLNRAYASDFILQYNEDMRTKEGLQKIKDLMSVDAIHIINNSGEVVLTSDESSEGVNLFEHEEAKNFWSLIKSSNKDEYVLDLEVISIVDKIPRDFIGVKSSIDEYSVLQIAVNKSVLAQLEDKIAIQEIIKYTSTSYDIGIFALDLETGEIISQTINNEQTLNFKNEISNKERLEKLKDAGEGRVFIINDSFKFVKSKQLGNMLVVSMQDAKEVMNEICMQVIVLAISIIIFLFTVLVMLNLYFKKYVFNDLKNIEDNIKSIVTGNMNVTFETKNKEYEDVVKVLNDWKKSYKNKSDRMSRLISGININIAAFECLYTINSNFFSNNIQNILGLDDDKWNNVNKTPKDFENYIYELTELKNDDGIIFVNDKYLEINSYKLDLDFFGAIIDRTEEIKHNRSIINSLKEAKEAAEKDFLTNLFNRAGFERRVHKVLENNPSQGIMIICDLDNFKKINDTLGHPEGDKILRLIGDFLSSEFRKHDIAARLGGDEFVVFINHEIPKEVLSIRLDRILNEIRELLGEYYNEYNLSMSIGVTYVNSNKATYKDLYRCADKALYIAKELGKDRFHINIFSNEGCSKL